MKRIAEVLVSITLSLAGLTGILVSVSDLAGIDIRVIGVRSTESMVLLILSLLSSAIGLERVLAGRRMEKVMLEVERFLRQSTRVRQIHGTPGIYEEGIRLIGLADSRIRAIVVAYPFKTPLEYSEAAAKRLQELDRQGRPARYDAVIVASKADLPQGFYDQVKARHEVYKNLGVGALVRIYLLDVQRPAGMDHFIVDRRHAAIAFTATADRENLATAIVFEDEPEIAEQCAEWFDQQILPIAERIV